MYVFLQISIELKDDGQEPCCSTTFQFISLPGNTNIMRIKFHFLNNRPEVDKRGSAAVE